MTPRAQQQQDDFTRLQAHLPTGWEECFDLKGAKKVKTAEDLLRILLPSFAKDVSLKEAAAAAAKDNDGSGPLGITAPGIGDLMERHAAGLGKLICLLLDDLPGMPGHRENLYMVYPVPYGSGANAKRLGFRLGLARGEIVVAGSGPADAQNQSHWPFVGLGRHAHCLACQDRLGADAFEAAAGRNVRLIMLQNSAKALHQLRAQHADSPSLAETARSRQDPKPWSLPVDFSDPESGGNVKGIVWMIPSNRVPHGSGDTDQAILNRFGIIFTTSELEASQIEKYYRCCVLLQKVSKFFDDLIGEGLHGKLTDKSASALIAGKLVLALLETNAARVSATTAAGAKPALSQMSEQSEQRWDLLRGDDEIDTVDPASAGPGPAAEAPDRFLLSDSQTLALVAAQILGGRHTRSETPGRLAGPLECGSALRIARNIMIAADGGVRGTTHVFEMFPKGDPWMSLTDIAGHLRTDGGWPMIDTAHKLKNIVPEIVWDAHAQISEGRRKLKAAMSHRLGRVVSLVDLESLAAGTIGKLVREARLDVVFGAGADDEQEQLIQSLLARVVAAVNRNEEDAISNLAVDPGLISRMCKGLDYDSLAAREPDLNAERLMELILAISDSFTNDPVGDDPGARRSRFQELARRLDKSCGSPPKGGWFASYIEALKDDKPDPDSARESLVEGIRQLEAHWALAALKEFAAVTAPKVNQQALEEVVAYCGRMPNPTSTVNPPAEKPTAEEPAEKPKDKSAEEPAEETPSSEESAEETTEDSAESPAYEESAEERAPRHEEERDLEMIERDLVLRELPDLITRLRGWLQGVPSGPYRLPRGAVRANALVLGEYAELLYHFSGCASEIRYRVMTSPVPRQQAVMEAMDILIAEIEVERKRITDPDWQQHKARIERGTKRFEAGNVDERLARARIRPRTLFLYAAERGLLPEELTKKVK